MIERILEWDALGADVAAITLISGPRFFHIPLKGICFHQSGCKARAGKGRLFKPRFLPIGAGGWLFKVRAMPNVLAVST